MAVKIATSIDLFAMYRSMHNYYVDKTGFIEDLLAQGERVFLFTRPRRFGKTLLMSMLAEFFDITKDSRNLFAGLKVSANEALCKEWMNEYPVIFLSLKDVEGKNFAEALDILNNKIVNLFNPHEGILATDKIWTGDRRAFEEIINRRATKGILRDSLGILTSVLNKYYQKRVIVLIDEYDAPVTRADTYGYYDEMIAFMRGFLSSALKSNPNLNFGIVTGCLRIAKESLFSEFNNPKCYDISSTEYADMFGFTQAEVDKLLQDAALSGKRDEIKKWYDGYCFGKNQEIYCPWSIMNYVADAQKDPEASPLAYWLNSGKNDLVRKFVARHVPEMADDIAVLLAGGCVVRKIETELSHESLELWQDSIWSLLYLAGYLTKASEARMLQSGARPKAALDEMALVIPNQEVLRVFAKDYVVWFQSIAKRQEDEIDTALWAGDAEKLVQLLEHILLKNISSRDLAGRKHGKQSKNKNKWATEDTRKSAPYENFYHAFLTGFLLSRYPDTLSNREIGKGFFDIRVIDDQRALVMEVKRTDNEKEDLAALVKKGLEQIEERRYNVDLADNPDITTVLHWSVAFCRKDCAARAIFVKRP